MKRIFYIFCFTILGALVGLCLIGFWELSSNVVNTNLIWLASLAFGILGFWSGVYWWKQIYVLNRLKNIKYKNIRFIKAVLLLILIGLLAWFWPRRAQSPVTTQGVQMQISSSSFEPNGAIPVLYTCKGKNINPELSFQDVPSVAHSLALVLQDPDAPVPGGFTHWVVFNMPPKTTSIPENSRPPGMIAENGSGQNEYTGPCPPSGTHHYHFTLYALDEMITAQVHDKATLEKAMAGHITAKAELVGIFKK